MVVINSITISWVQAVGGSDTIYNIVALFFVFTVVFIFYRISV